MRIYQKTTYGISEMVLYHMILFQMDRDLWNYRMAVNVFVYKASGSLSEGEYARVIPQTEAHSSLCTIVIL